VCFGEYIYLAIGNLNHLKFLKELSLHSIFWDTASAEKFFTNFALPETLQTLSLSFSSNSIISDFQKMEKSATILSEFYQRLGRLTNLSSLNLWYSRRDSKFALPIALICQSLESVKLDIIMYYSEHSQGLNAIEYLNSLTQIKSL